MTQEEFFNRYKYDRTKDRIGGGGFGNVYKVFDTIENETVALKITEVKQGQESLSLLKEVELASSLNRHVNIARYTACYRFDLPNGHFDFGILQYYPLGNLSQLVKTKKLSNEEKEQIAKGVISGIQHLHNNNIVHRDLKSANILIAQGYQGEYVPKIADFGLSKQFSQNVNSYFSNSFAGGSLLYVAPEQLEGKELRKNVDLWSLGVVLFELFVGETPFRASVDDGSETARAEIISKIKNGTLPNEISVIPQPWQGIIKSCLIVDPLKRLKSIEDVMKSIQSIKDDYPEISLNTEVETSLGKKLGTSPPPIFPKPTWFKHLIVGIVITAFFILAGLIYNNTGRKINAQEVTQEISSQMVKVSGGTFMMGCSREQESACNDDEKPAHRVTIKSFQISKHEVTQEQFEAIMGYNPSSFKNCRRCPVENVSSSEVQGFIRELNKQTGKNYRLPKEAEWEFAARGNQSFIFAGSDNLDEVGWYGENSRSKTHPVGKKDANGFGLYDMSGNVWELCDDWLTSYSFVNKSIPQWEMTNLVMRGGVYHCKEDWCRVSKRMGITPNFRIHLMGFRLASN